MKKIVAKYVSTTKGGFHTFSSPEINGLVYLAGKAFTGKPVSVEITADFAVPVAGKPVAADKLAAELDKTRKRLAALEAQSGAKLVKAPRKSRKPVAPVAPEAPAAETSTQEVAG
jgi:hypothetical protein